jgi:hypothetical protein
MPENKLQLIELTLQVWKPRTTRPLTGDDARQIAENATGFFLILEEWETKQQIVTDRTRNEPATGRQGGE